MDFGLLLQLLISGCAAGSMYALVALGHVMIWNAMGVLNFAHSEMVMLGGFLSLTFFVVLGLPYWLTFILVLICGCIIGAIIQRTMYQYMFFKRATRENFIIASIGLQVVLINLANVIWGSENFAFPDIFKGKTVELFGAIIPIRNFYILGTAFILVIVLTLVLERTKVGTGMRAVAQDREYAGAIGINVGLSDMLTFMVASSLGCVAGLLLAPVYLVTAGLGQAVALKAFATAVVGGFSNMMGAIVGGLFIGSAENLVSGFMGSEYKDAVAFIIMLVVLCLKPEGIMGKRTKKVKKGGKHNAKA
ncbi:MAG TPA: branched-chain amino acid ABC transporter permease [Anaerovoracaceae bacterium]|nr:branched-chain amino acid ABC transporter permease [Anaerovoracaceae bacterium]